MPDDDDYWPDRFSDELLAWMESVSTGDWEREKLIEMCRRAAEEMIADAVARPRQANRKVAGEQAEFEARLEARWGRGLDLADLAVDQAFESGKWANDRLQAAASTALDGQHEALIRLHCKAVMTAREVMLLLRSGYSSGALARWRTLHEVWVVFLLLVQGDTELSRRYLAHEAFENFKGQEDYEQTWEAIGLEPPDWDPAERDEIRAQLENEFGSEFWNPYGWAAQALDLKSPTFGDLQKRVGLDGWRGFYRLASQGTHANPKGTLWNIQSREPTEVAWAGPSDSGLADPAQCTLIGLTRITAELLAHAIQVLTESEELADQIIPLLRHDTTRILMEHAIDELADAHAQREAEEEAISDLADRALESLHVDNPTTVEELSIALDVEHDELEAALAVAVDRGQLRQDTVYQRVVDLAASRNGENAR